MDFRLGQGYCSEFILLRWDDCKFRQKTMSVLKCDHNLHSGTNGGANGETFKIYCKSSNNII